MSSPPEPGSTALAAEAEEPPVLPFPSTECQRLSRRQSILAWSLGLIVGMAIAAGAIVAVVLR